MMKYPITLDWTAVYESDDNTNKILTRLLAKKEQVLLDTSLSKVDVECHVHPKQKIFALYIMN